MVHPEPNGKVERMRALGAILLSCCIVFAIVFLVSLNLENQVANVVAGGLVVSLKDAIALFTRTGPLTPR